MRFRPLHAFCALDRQYQPDSSASSEAPYSSHGGERAKRLAYGALKIVKSLGVVDPDEQIVERYRLVHA